MDATIDQTAVHPPATDGSAEVSATGATWALLLAAPEHVRAVRERFGVSEVAARCLAVRLGAQSVSGADGWLSPDVGQLHDPWTMHGMDAAVDRLLRALKDRQKIRVVTDYDVDGTTSSLILQAALRLVSPDATVDYHIPDRFVEGYGFSVRAADAAAAAGVDLVVTADIGVRDHAAVARARERGVDVLVCDHHLPEGADVPPGAFVLCPPQPADSYANPYLAACGISLKVGQALLQHHPKRDRVVRSLMKLAAIGTVADLVPITTLENRAIVALGLQELNQGPHTPGLQALIEASGLLESGVRESDLGFRIAPRINAAGRVADAKLVVELLNCRDVGRARQLAAEIDRLNTQRRDIQARLVEEVTARLAADPNPDPFVVVAGPEEEGWHRGVVGIVASKIKDVVHRPVAVVSIQGDRAVGSVRSVPGVHAVRALTSVRDLLEKFGGHPVAAGFTVPTAKLDELRARLGRYVLENAGQDALRHVREVDAYVDVTDLGQRLYDELEALGPFGQGNPRPRLVVRGVRARGIELKANERLLRFFVPRPGGGGVEAVWWEAAEHAPLLAKGPVDVYGELGEHRWKGSRKLQLEVRDIKQAS